MYTETVFRTLPMSNPLKLAFLALFFGSLLIANPVHLRCEYQENPLGIDQRTPHLSWQSDNTERNWRQSAYEILVSHSVQALKTGKADVWDSHKISVGESIGIAYAGPKLDSRKRYYWTVRVWDGAGKPSAWARASWWEMGLLEKEDWHAKWIASSNLDEPADRAAIHWIWVSGQDAHKVAPGTVGVFRTTFDLAAKPTDAALFLLATGDWKVKVNDQDAGSKTVWHSFDRRDITNQLVSGNNLVEISMTVPPPPAFGPGAGPANTPQPAALAALVKVLQTDGSTLRLGSNKDWQNAVAVAELDDPGKPFGAAGPLPQPATGFRKSFPITDKVESARLYMTALGAYSAFLNGKRVGDSHLNPGWTNFDKHLQYQAYDVTALLNKGENILSALLGDGWFASPLAWIGNAHDFGPPPTRLIGQLEIHFTSGKTETIATDQSWNSHPTGILNSEIYKGEEYDARLEPLGWKEPRFSDAQWPAATLAETPKAQLVAQQSSPIRTVKTLKPETVTSPAAGVYIFDMGQNFAGNAILKAHGPEGTRIKMRFAEILDPDGGIYTKNLRNADATNIFVLRGDAAGETFSPEFTFEGFRYVEVTGYPGKPSLDDLSAEVISSLPFDPAATIETDNQTVNQMWKLGIWGQLSNFITIPTDCPQRDERLGWTGDAGVFWRTGSYNFNIAPFTHKWMQDMRDSQSAEGAFPNVAPDILPFGPGAPGWGDAGVIVPWTAWMQYGDREVIKENWAAMERWMDYIHKDNPDFLRKNGVGPNFADWLAPDPNTPTDLVDTAYWALVARMMSQMAEAVNDKGSAEKYALLYEQINQAFQKAYVKEDGAVGAGTQTGYVLALHAGLYPKNVEPALVKNLVAAIEKSGGYLSTGFLGTPFLLFALSDHGRPDAAYKLLLADSYPSWGYMIRKGATTWWERWNGDTGDPAMNSYNHYSFGSVVAWMYRSVGGIDTSERAPGFREILIHPRPDEHLTHARTEYQSVYGKISTDWNGTPTGPFTLKVTIPANTHARVELPSPPNAKFSEGGRAMAGPTVEVGSGTYEFKVVP